MEVFHIPDYTLIMLSAYSRWSLKAPTYPTLPIQVMARIAEIEEADDICDEEGVGSAEEQATLTEEGDALALYAG